MRNVETLAARIKAAGIKADIQYMDGGCIGVMTARRNVGRLLNIAELVGYVRTYRHTYEYLNGAIKSRANKTPLIIFY